MDFKTVVAACVGACVCVATSARGATIALPTPLTGSAPASFVDLEVSFEPNGSTATNITGWELYVAFSGLEPMDASFALGSIFQPVAADVIELHGVCSSGAPCSEPPADAASSQQWVSLASVFTPHLPTGPGTLFTLRFAVIPGATEWSLDVFGESADLGDACGASSALLWEHPADGPCAIVPFLIVAEGNAVAEHTAIVAVAATARSPHVVPEPPFLLLISASLAALLARRYSR